MPYKKDHRHYFYNPEGYQEKDNDGVRYYRDNSMEPGKWHRLPHAADRLLQHVIVLTQPRSQIELFKKLHIDSATASRIRNNKMLVPLEWFVKISDYTGLTLEELRAISGLKPVIKRYNESEE